MGVPLSSCLDNSIIRSNSSLSTTSFYPLKNGCPGINILNPDAFYPTDQLGINIIDNKIIKEKKRKIKNIPKKEKEEYN